MDLEEKEKAEKLAAAKKRFEQLKKQKAGATKKTTAKKKEDKVEDSTTKDTPAATVNASSTVEEPESNVDDAPATKPKSEEDTSAATDGADATEDTTTDGKSSLTLQSRQRSESFRKTVPAAGSLKSPTLATVDAQEEINTARLEQLEAELAEKDEEIAHLQKDKDESTKLRTKADLAESRAEEIEKLKSELATAQRQLTQAQQNASKTRRTSMASPNSDLTAQLASKTTTIESLELELSTLRYQITSFEADKSTLESNLKIIEARAEEAEAKHKAGEEELEKLRSTIKTSASESAPSSGGDSAALQSRITVLESDLRTAQASLDAASNKASNLETKVETLTKLHRESSTQNAGREKEVKELKARVKTLTSTRDATTGEDLSDLEDEERERLNARIRDLEAETFELRRGVWRDQRAAMQPGMDDGSAVSAGYEDVDLNTTTPYGTSRGSFGAGARQTSTFSDVLQSGISAFTGRDHPRAGKTAAAAQSHQRAASLSLMSEEGFDEDAFRLAQEDEAKARIERIKEVKRGLEQWRGWRLDLVDQRHDGLSGVHTGPVFDI